MLTPLIILYVIEVFRKHYDINLKPNYGGISTYLVCFRPMVSRTRYCRWACTDIVVQLMIVITSRYSLTVVGLFSKQSFCT